MPGWPADRLSRMPERSMPERTVDTWVASAICSVSPDARIWDPTQAMRGRNWDRAFLPLEAGRVFIFEDKGTTAVTRTRKRPLQTHRIEIDAAQLNWYCDEVEPASRIPVYYVLPRPPWNGGAGSGHVPEQATCRVTSAAGPFPQWAYVSRYICQWPSYGLRWWPGKVPAPSGLLGLGQGGSSFGSGLAHTVGIAVSDHDIRVMQ